MVSGACLDGEAIAALADARLPEGEAAAATAHVRQCAGCWDAVATTMSGRGVVPDDVTQALGQAPPGSSASNRLQRAGAPQAFVAPALEVGAVVGRYTVLGLVGRGGMGEVYVAHDPTLDRKVALKMLLADVSADDQLAQERLLREAQAIAKLSHPNVVVVYDVGTLLGRAFVAMEFVEGTTLAAWLRQKERPWREIVDAFVAAARGLAAAHRAGIVHRDFKPQNVMVSGDGAVRVMDFGLARRIGLGGGDASIEAFFSSPPVVDVTLTRTGDQVGTPLYMAPEQFANGVIDARTDQFSFCVALFWALYGVHPFGAVNAAEPPGAAPQPATGAPAWVRRVLARGLSTDPAARWPSMNDLVVALTRDPGRGRRAAVLSSVALAACVAVGVGAAHWASARRALCTGGPALTAGVWDVAADGARAGSRREALRAAIVAAGGKDAAGIWDQVSAALDRRIEKWRAAYRGACEATHVRHEQSSEVLDLRMACLNDALDSTRALTELLAKGEPSVVAHATTAVRSLDELDRCSDVGQLLLGIRPPKDPLVRARADELRRKLRDGSALYEAGSRAAALKVAAAVLAEAQPLQYCPLEAEAVVLKGDCEIGLGSPEAGATLERAVVLAESCGHDRVVAEAATQLTAWYGAHDVTAAERNGGLAQAAIKRSGGDVRTEGWLANNLGIAHAYAGQLDAAIDDYSRALEIKAGSLGPDHVDVAISRVNLATALYFARRYAESLSAVERGLAIEQRTLGAEPRMLIDAFNTRALDLLRLGRLDEAEAAFKDAMRFNAERIGGDAFVTDVLSGGLGAVLAARGRPRAALPLLERGLRAGASESRFELAMAELEVAKARGAIRPTDRSAVELARQAEAVFAEQRSLAPYRRDAAAWIEAHSPAKVAVNKR